MYFLNEKDCFKSMSLNWLSFQTLEDINLKKIVVDTHSNKNKKVKNVLDKYIYTEKVTNNNKEKK